MHCTSCETDSRLVNGTCSYCGAAHTHGAPPATKDTWASTLEQVRLPIRGTLHSRAFAAPPLARARVRRSSAAVIAVAAAALLVVVALPWFVVAERIMKAEISRFESTALVVEKARKSSFDGQSRPLNAIHFDDLAGYVETFDQKKAELAAAIDHLAEGDGMGFWTEGRRKTLVSEFGDRLRREEETARASRSALDAERPRHLLVLAAIDEGRARRARAVRALLPETDEGGYSTELTSLAKGLAGLRKIRLDLEQSLTTDGIRRALCVAMTQDLEAEKLALQNRAARTRSAQSLLHNYKNAVKAKLRESRGLIVLLDDIGTLQPTVDLIFTKSVPVRDFMRSISEPLPFSGMTLGKPATMLSIAATFDPRIEAAGDLLVFTCSAIEIAHEEVGLIVARITPLSSATTAFLASNSRADMLVLIDTAPPVASYFEMHSTMFDPVLEKIDSLRPYVRLLKLAATDIENPLGRAAFQGLASTAEELIELSEVPFLNGKAYIIATGASLRSLEGLEQTYRTNIASLK